MYISLGLIVYFNFVVGTPSNQLVATQSKIIYNIFGSKQEYMSLVYTHINATLFSVAHYQINGMGSVGGLSNRVLAGIGV